MQMHGNDSPTDVLDENNSRSNGIINNKKPTKSLKVVKNFNEFLNFASMNKSRISDRLSSSTGGGGAGGGGGGNNNTQSSKKDLNDDKLYPLIKLTKSSFDDSETSSATETPPLASNNSTVDNKKPPLQLQLSNIMIEKQASFDGSSPDDSQEYFPMTTSMTRELRLELENLDRHVFGTDFHQRTQFSAISGCETPESGDSIDKMPEFIYKKLNQNSIDCFDLDSDYGGNGTETLNSNTTKPSTVNENLSDISSCPVLMNGDVKCRNKPKDFDESKSFKRISTSSANNDIFIWENPLRQFSSSPQTIEVEIETVKYKDLTTPDEQCDLDYDGEIIEENLGKKSVTPIRLVRKNGSNNNSNRNSMLNDIDSDTSDSWNENKNDIELTPIAVTTPDNINATITIPKNIMTNSVEEASEAQALAIQELAKEHGILPPPKEFGSGNPFLMFLCLTILLQHRDIVIKSGMDYNEMAMHFDKMVRKHNVTRVLNQARRMYAEYLKSQHAHMKNSENARMSNNNLPTGSTGGNCSSSSVKSSVNVNA